MKHSESKAKNATFFLLSFIAMASVGCQHPNEVKKDCRFRNLSETFRETAGDTFDRLQSLETHELEGQIYYQLAEQEADRAVLKTQRIASNADEKNLSDFMGLYFETTRTYRETTKLLNSVTDEPDWEKQPWRVAYRDKWLPILSDTEKHQQQSKTVIAACVSVPMK